MKPRTPGFWLIVATVGLLALLPMQAVAGMTQAEVKLFAETKLKADNGDAEAQCLLGRCYFYGEGVAKDRVEALRRYRESSDQGYAEAQYYLGVCYYVGVVGSMPKDQIEACAYFNLPGVSRLTTVGGISLPIREYIARVESTMAPEAVSQGKQRAKKLQKEIDVKTEARKSDELKAQDDRMTPEKVKAYKTCKAAADRGDAEAQLRLANYYAEGEGVPKDFPQAITWLRKAADQGFAEAQYRMGGITERGLDGILEKDDVEALKWYRKAADQGYAAAAKSLDLLNRKTASKETPAAKKALATVTPAEVKAFEEFRAQVDQGVPHARYKLGAGRYNGLGVEKDDNEALQWLHKAADQENDSALELLANIYFEGKAGAAKNQVEAVRLSRKGAEQGHLRFLTGLGFFYHNGFGVPKDDVEAYAYYSFADITGDNVGGSFYRLEKSMTPEAIMRGKQRMKTLQSEIETKGAWADSLEMKKTFKAIREEAEQGKIPAQFRLGYLYAIGQGVSRNEVEAYAYWHLEKTVETDNSEQTSMLTALERWMSPEQIIHGQKRTKELQKEIEAKIDAKKAGK